jgi:hypothetical protein
MKKSKKAKKKRNANTGSAYPPGYKKPIVMKLLWDWQHTMITIMDGKHTGHVVVYFMSPKKKVYRASMPYENPTLLIASPIFPEVRLTRIKSKKIIKEVRRALRRN